MSNSAGITDVAAVEDLFGITRYINGLYEFLDECKTPMTMAIQGDWGTGKTSIMKMVSNKLKDKYGGNLVWFNTWQFSQFDLGDQLPMLLMSKLINQLGGTNSADIKERAVKIAKGIINITSGILSQGSTDGQVLTDALFKDNFADSFEKLAEVFSDLVKKKTKNEDDKVIVFVDDLDRLPPSKAVELLEVMKNFFDCERCVFVLAIDYNVVIRGVKEKYGQDFDDEKGKSFFDKIIQVPFRMPVSSYNIQNYVKDNMGKIGIVINDDEELKQYVELIDRSIGENPRSMKRLFNAFLLLKKVADTGIYEDKQKRLMLFAMLCMQTKYGNVYDEVIRMNKERVTEFLSGLGSDDFNSIKGFDLTQDEEESFVDFAEILYDVINTDKKDGISTDECDVFLDVLNFSSITSNDSKAGTKTRGSRLENDINSFTMSYKTKEQVEELYNYVKQIAPEARYELVMGNNGVGHIAGRPYEKGSKFMDMGGRKDGFSIDLIVPSPEYYEEPIEYDVFKRVMDHFGVSPQKKYYAGKCICVTVPESDMEGKRLVADMIKVCYELSKR